MMAPPSPRLLEAPQIQVLFAEAHRRRRRRWAAGIAVLALTGLAAAITGGIWVLRPGPASRGAAARGRALRAPRFWLPSATVAWVDYGGRVHLGNVATRAQRVAGVIPAWAGAGWLVQASGRIYGAVSAVIREFDPATGRTLRLGHGTGVLPAQPTGATSTSSASSRRLVELRASGRRILRRSRAPSWKLVPGVAGEVPAGASNGSILVSSGPGRPSSAPAASAWRRGIRRPGRWRSSPGTPAAAGRLDRAERPRRPGRLGSPASCQVRELPDRDHQHRYPRDRDGPQPAALRLRPGRRVLARRDAPGALRADREPQLALLRQQLGAGHREHPHGRGAGGPGRAAGDAGERRLDPVAAGRDAAAGRGAGRQLRGGRQHVRGPAVLVLPADGAGPAADHNIMDTPDINFSAVLLPSVAARPASAAPGSALARTGPCGGDHDAAPHRRQRTGRSGSLASGSPSCSELPMPSSAFTGRAGTVEPFGARRRAGSEPGVGILRIKTARGSNRQNSLRGQTTQPVRIIKGHFFAERAGSHARHHRLPPDF